MRTIETRIYRYEELDGFAQRKALAHFSDINLDTDWWQPTYETWHEIGVVIKSFDLYKKHINLDLMYSFEDTATSFISYFGENHEGYKFAQDFLMHKKKLDKTYENSFDEFGECQEYDEELEIACRFFYADLKDSIYTWLDAEWEYLQSEEAVEESIIANEIEFTKDGRVFDYE